LTHFVEVQVKIPADRLGEFYGLLGQFLAESASDSAARPYSADKSDAAPEDWSSKRIEMWTSDGSNEDRERKIRRYMSALNSIGFRFLQYLLQQDEHEAAASVIVRDLGFNSPRSLAGSLATFGFMRNRFGLLQPFEARTDSDVGTVYFIPPEIAKVLRGIYE
jgi:hypothetical protein